MRISRRLPRFRPLTLGVSMLTVPLALPAASPTSVAPVPMRLAQATPSEADARLRQLLEQKIRELDGAGTSRSTSAPVATRIIAPTPASTNNEAAIRQLLDQKANELNAQPQAAVEETKAQERARRKAEKEAQKRAVEDARRRAQEEAQRTKEAARVAEENAKTAARLQQEADKVAKEKALADQKAREEQERQERINKIKADLAGPNAPKPATAPASVAAPVVAAPVVTAPPSVPPPPPPAPLVAAPTNAKPVTPPVAPASPDSDAARRVLEQKIRELDAATAVAPPPAQPVTAPRPVPAPAVVVTPAPAPAALVPVDESTRALLEQKTRELSDSAAAAPTATAKRPASAPKASKDRPELEAIPEPPAPAIESPLPKTKQQKLAELLEAYRHNLITAADYHNSRARILAEP